MSHTNQTPPQKPLAMTYSDVAVGLDLIDPEAVLHQRSSSAEQLLQLSECERPHLNKRFVSHNSLQLFQTVRCSVTHQKENSSGLTRLHTWTILETFPRGGEGCWAVRTGSSMVMETPIFCWLMERRMRVSLGVTGIKKKGQRFVFLSFRAFLCHFRVRKSELKIPHEEDYYQCSFLHHGWCVLATGLPRSRGGRPPPALPGSLFFLGLADNPPLVPLVCFSSPLSPHSLGFLCAPPKTEEKQQNRATSLFILSP